MTNMLGCAGASFNNAAGSGEFLRGLQQCETSFQRGPPAPPEASPLETLSRLVAQPRRPAEGALLRPSGLVDQQPADQPGTGADPRTKSGVPADRAKYRARSRPDSRAGQRALLGLVISAQPMAGVRPPRCETIDFSRLDYPFRTSRPATRARSRSQGR